MCPVRTVLCTRFSAVGGGQEGSCAGGSAVGGGQEGSCAGGSAVGGVMYRI